MYPLLSEPNCTHPYYTIWVWHVDTYIWTKVKYVPSPNISSATQCYYTMWVWHVDAYIWTQVYCTPFLIELSATESYYTMFVSHVNECICNQITCTHPLLTESSASGPCYTMSVWHVEACRHTQMRCIPINQTQCCRALQHHVCLTCTRMQMYPGQMYPTLIKPSASEHYYTMCVWHVQEYSCTQVRCTPLSWTQ